MIVKQRRNPNQPLLPRQPSEWRSLGVLPVCALLAPPCRGQSPCWLGWECPSWSPPPMHLQNQKKAIVVFFQRWCQTQKSNKDQIMIMMKVSMMFLMMTMTMTITMMTMTMTMTMMMMMTMMAVTVTMTVTMITMIMMMMTMMMMMNCVRIRLLDDAVLIHETNCAWDDDVPSKLFDANMLVTGHCLQTQDNTVQRRHCASCRPADTSSYDWWQTGWRRLGNKDIASLLPWARQP